MIRGQGRPAGVRRGRETVNRRQLLKVLGLGAVTVASLPLLEACAPAPAAPKPADSKPAEAAKPADASKPATAAKPADTKPAQAAAGAPKRGGSATIVVQNDWVSFDPPFNTAEPGGSNMIYGSWINWKPNASGAWGPAPDLVAEWDAKPDQLTLKLQSGVKF